jgi:hypothetical protein
MFNLGRSAGGTMSSPEDDVEMPTALRFGRRSVACQSDCENCQLS